MSARASLLSRTLQPLTAAVWIFFVTLSLAVGVVWAGAISDADVARWVSNRDLARTFFWLLSRLDFAWITLAAVNVYFGVTARQGLATARRWTLAVFGVVTAATWLSAWTGFPLGPMQYSGALGPKLGPVPLGLPLFWLTVIIGAREGMLRFFPRWSQAQIAFGVALLAALTDLSLEPLASKLRGYWFWRSATPNVPPGFDAPLLSCLVWGAMAGLLAFTLREKSVVAAARPRSWQPAATLVIFHLVFVAAHLGRWLRN